MSWIEQFCGDLLRARHPGSLVDHYAPTDGEGYLSALFGGDEASVMALPDLSDFLKREATVPHPIERHPLVHRYEGFDAWSIVRGFRPAAMEQKWCFRTEMHDGRHALAVYRSWTGLPVWRWWYERRDDALEFSEFEVAAHSDDYTPLAPDKEGRQLRAIVEDWLLGKPTLWQTVLEDHQG